MAELPVQSAPAGPLPPGATPEGVADNVPIMASEGEYVIPEAVVRFIGLDKLEKMVAKAQETLSAMEEAGRIGGQEEGEEDEELPFDPNTLESVPHMAEGGVVGDPNMFDQGAGFTGVKSFESNGRVTFIPYVDGEPLTPVPQGAKEISPGETPAPTTSTSSPEKSGTGASTVNSNSRENDSFIEENRSNLSRDPSTWTVDDFVDFGKQRGSVGETAMKGIISMMPLGKIAVQVREKQLDSISAKSFDQMLDTGLDMQGNPLTDEQRVSLEAARENLKQQMGEESGLNLSPFQRLGDVFERVGNFLNPAAAPAKVTMSSRDGPVGSPMSSLSAEGTSMTSGESGSGNPSSGGGYGMGSDMGRDPSSGPSEGSMASGGLYYAGGLVKRRTETKR